MTAGRAAFIAALAAAVAYWGTLDAGFAWDDHIHIEAAPFVQDPANLRTLATAGFWSGRSGVEGSARPVVLASLLIDRALWGDSPWGYHLTNVALHAAASAALAAVASSAATPVVGLLAGLLFALHPVQTEAVCGITFRADPLAALFGLIALLCARRVATGGRGWAAGAAASFGLALLSKESAVVIPVLWWAWRALIPEKGESKGRALLLAACFAAVLLLYAAFRAPRGGYASVGGAPSTTAAPAAGGAIDPSPPPWKAALPTRASRVAVMLGVLADDARLTVWPSGLQADRQPDLAPERRTRRAAAGLAVLAALTAAVWGLRRRSPAAALGLAWWAVALAPVSGVVTLHNLIAERYLYLPTAGAALAAAVGAEALSRRSRRPAWALAAVSTVALCAAAAATVRRVPAWRDDRTLFSGLVVTDGARLRYNRGRLAREAGRLEEARREYRAALELDPASVETLVNLAETERSLGATPREELALLRRAAALNPTSAVVWENVGDALLRDGKTKEAVDAAAKAASLDATSARARAKWAVALREVGRRDEALRRAAEASRLDAKDADVQYALGRLAEDESRWSQAEASFRRAVKAAPSHGLAWANLGVCLHRQGRLKEALGAMRSAVKLLPSSPDAHRNLGALLDDMGREKEAAVAYRETVRLQPSFWLNWHALGVVLQKAGDDTGAAEAYARSISLDQDHPQSMVNLAAVRVKQGAYERAAICLREARRVAPGHPIVLAAIRDFERKTGITVPN